MKIMYVNCGVKSDMKVYQAAIDATFAVAKRKPEKKTYVAVCRSEVFVKKRIKFLHVHK